MITWVDYRDSIRASLLNDSDGTEWEDGQVHQYIAWAIDDFATHTPFVAEVNYSEVLKEDLSEYNFNSDVFYPYVYDPHPDHRAVKDTVGIYLVNDSTMYATEGYSLDYDGIYFDNPPGNPVVMRCYSYYPIPEPNDIDALLYIPRWAQSALKHRILSYALSSPAYDTAEIRQFATRRDSGNPEHNPLLQFQKWQEQMYQTLITSQQVLERIPL